MGGEQMTCICDPLSITFAAIVAIIAFIIVWQERNK